MIQLDLIERNDLQKIIEWNANKSADDLLQWAGPKFDYPLTILQLESYFINEVKKENSNINVYKIRLGSTNEMIGTIELSEIDKDNRIGKIGRFLIGTESNRGKGIGTLVLNEAIRIGFEEMGFEKIILGVFDFNHGAIKCYQKIGFNIEKFIENSRKSSNGYWNLYEMGITKSIWQAK